MAAGDNYAKISGVQKVAAILLSVEEPNALRLFELMTEDEIKNISFAMSSLGSLKRDILDRMLFEFAGELSNAVSLTGNVESTERLLEKALGKEKLGVLMEEIRGPAGKNTWDKLGNVNEDILAAYLRNEYPQTIALIISKLTPQHAAKLLSILPEDLTLDVMLRLLNMEPVKKEILDGVEKTLRQEFISTLAKTQKADSNVVMAEIFNNFDRNNENKYMGMLESRVPESAEKIKNLMFTFEDLLSIDSAGIQVLMRVIDKAKLTIALKGASDKVRELFVHSMSQRAAKILKEEMEALGPVRLRDVDEAQGEIVNTAKELAAKGDIIISDGDVKEEFIY